MSNVVVYVCLTDYKCVYKSVSHDTINLPLTHEEINNRRELEITVSKHFEKKTGQSVQNYTLQSEVITNYTEFVNKII